MNNIIRLVLFMGTAIICYGAAHKGYLASIGPYPIRFIFNIPQDPIPQIDYLPIPRQLTNNNETAGQTSPQTLIISTSSEFYGPPLPQSNSVEIITSSPPDNTMQTQIQPSTNTMAISTNENQIIPPQIFVNYFKNQNNLSTNNSPEVIVAPNFTPPPPPSASGASSRSTYIIK